MSLAIVPAVSKADIDLFLRLPARLYRDFPSYTAPLHLDRQTLLDPRKGSFFKHGKVQYWLARRDGEPVGRISAQIDFAQPAGAFQDAGLFGCLDAIDDAEVVAALLATAEAWLRDEGRSRAAGPFALSMNGEPGLLVAGQDEPPLALVAWHPPYLSSHVVAAGYAACKDLHYWRLSDLPKALPAILSRKQRRAGPAEITARPLDRRHAERDLEILRTVYNAAWVGNWGFVPLQPVDIEAIKNDLRPFLREEYGVIVERQGKPIGVGLCVPNLFEVTSDLGVDLSPLAWARLAYRSLFHRFSTGFVILLGVVPEIRNTWGGAVVAMTLVDELFAHFAGVKNSLKWVEAGWVLDNNVALQKILVEYGFERVRTLRLFDKALEPN